MAFHWQRIEHEGLCHSEKPFAAPILPTKDLFFYNPGLAHTSGKIEQATGKFYSISKYTMTTVVAYLCL
jgi:hypothetical protein